MNSCNFIGRFVADPELRTVGKDRNGKDTLVTSFRLAIDRKYVKAGQQREADFLNFVAWNGQAEHICKHFGKGDTIGLETHVQSRQYEDVDGNKRNSVEFVVDNVTFAGRTKKDAERLTAAE